LTFIPGARSNALMARFASSVVLASMIWLTGACAGGDPGDTTDAAATDARAIDARELDARPIDARDIDAALPQDGLAAWWRFEEVEDTTILDATGHGHDGTRFGNFERVPGKVGQALRLLGGYVRIPASPGLDFTTAATVELWLKVPASTLAGGVFNLVSRGTGNNDNLFSINSSCGNVQTIFQHVGVGTVAPTTPCGALTADRWIHLAIVNDGVHAYLYLDGVLADVPDQGGDLVAIANDLFFGRREQGVFVLTDGTLDEIKWWTVARTAAQICADAGGSDGGGPCTIP
jgi:hypothetical protein